MNLQKNYPFIMKSSNKYYWCHWPCSHYSLFSKEYKNKNQTRKIHVNKQPNGRKIYYTKTLSMSLSYYYTHIYTRTHVKCGRGKKIIIRQKFYHKIE